MLAERGGEFNYPSAQASSNPIIQLQGDSRYTRRVRACFQSFPQDIRSPPAPLIKGGAILKVPLF
ncbi:hypothetical protein LYNGBM3L_39690 [Moorena producens 3L]|uniref:Uncharacterized protein n=1 Tax=Moorena producens 3L TaxID=489825 RepID=F4XV70_9CYAN|nr:hypothetical protein LYNGBM3L_39690 [Moorena producens 3L]OLT68756.1 hypothetical protein BI334_30450 [Moorena producens 3L]